MSNEELSGLEEENSILRFAKPAKSPDHSLKLRQLLAKQGNKDDARYHGWTDLTIHRPNDQEPTQER